MASKIVTSHHNLSVELTETLKLALPMLLTHIGQIVMTTTDLALAGRLGADALAAAALAGRVYIISVTFGVGLLAAIGPVAAEAFARGNLGVARRSLRMGMWAGLLLSLPMVAFALHGEEILLAFDQDSGLARLAQQYLFGLAGGVAPMLWFQAIRNFMAAVNRPEPVLWVTLTAIPLNGLLGYMLVYGKFGLPRLELFGLGLATTLVNCGMFSASFCFARMRRPFRAYNLFADFWRVDWCLMRHLGVIGTPIAVASLLGFGLFSAAALLAGRISTSAVAAHQIAFQVAAILFTVSFGLGVAATVRVSHAVGRNDGHGIRRAGLVAMLLGFIVSAFLTGVVIVARFKIANLFLGDSDADTEATLGLAAKLLLVGASFFVSDAIAHVAAGSLRGLKDTRSALLFAFLAYWLIGYSVSYVLGLQIGLGAVGIWIGLSVGTSIYAGLLVLRFHRLSSRLVL
ncbi:multidrug transporter MatE [Bradyrhizobium nanningense]|uniref:Multidrug transporter MatE n=1 Tax=Bradyrhizobium nanningense TaxID=1325118 RepID=A0A4Q0SFF4_9BRAD|nr:MATE family efflux transporter [Bradyrhizobium nanningense]RXH37917.1 multidrug transporter MatE [Bradyrhizobium nanningense]